MKKLLITLLVLLVLGAIIFGLLHFFWTAERFAAAGDKAMAAQDYSKAEFCYNKAVELSDGTPEYAVSLADAAIAEGSFTKAERALVKAIAAQPSIELYCKLSQVYVAQDKLLDAQELLDGIANEAIAAEIAQLRPLAPEFSHESGEYAENIALELSAADGSIYYSLDKQYPTTASQPYAEPIELTSGSSRVTAVTLSQDGLVSPLASGDYLIKGVVEEVRFASPELETYVRDLLYIPRTSSVMTSDLWTITELSVPEDVTDLSDLRHFTSLTSLTLPGSDAESYDFLTATTQLKYLDLSGCLISADTLADIGALAQLQELYLSGCGLSNIDALAGNTELTVLDLSGNSISDVAVLAGLPKLSELNLSSNAISALDALRGISSLTTLDISENNISYLSPLSGCTLLEQLVADGNRIVSLDALASMPKLQNLSLSKNQVADISPLAVCTELSRLELASNQLTAVDAIASMPKLAYLDISYNAVTALPALDSQLPLQQFNAAYNQLEDISALSGLAQLAYVNVDYNEAVTDIECLSGCILLVQVDAFGTQVETVAALTDLGIIVNYNPAVEIEG